MLPPDPPARCLAPDEFVSPPGEPAYDAVFVGELRQLKGVATLLEAAALLSQRPNTFRLGIAGAGPDEAALRTMASKMRLEGNVDFLGFRKAREVFALGRVVVVPSYAESFPYIVLEAIAAGRPVVASSVGGIPEMFGSAASALVVPGDAAALASAIASTLDDPVVAQARAGALRERARRLYRIETMAASVTDSMAKS